MSDDASGRAGRHQAGRHQAERILAWGLLVAFLFVNAVARAFYSSQALEASARFEALSSLAFVWFLWLWVNAEGREPRVALPMDAGLFLCALSFAAIPFLLWRSQRWRSVGKAAVLIGVWMVSYALTVVVHLAIVWLQS